MFRGLKARLNDSITSSEASFLSAETSTPNTSIDQSNSNDNGTPGLFGKFKQKLTEVVNNTSAIQDVETPESVTQITDDELMEIDKLVIVTPTNQLPDLFRKQAVSRLKLRKKLKYTIGQYNDVVYEHNNRQEDNKNLREELKKLRSSAALAGEYKHQLGERSELIFQLQSQIEILKETALVPEVEPNSFVNNASSGAALIDISECSESIMSDASETVRNMSYEQLYDRYQRYRIRYTKNKDRLEKLSVSCQRIQKQNEKLQSCLTISQDRAIKKITQLKDTTNHIVDENKELACSLSDKDDRILHLKEQLVNISAMGGFSDTESIVSEASEYSEQLTDNLRRKNVRLKEKVKRLEDILSKCKTTIQNGIETTALLNHEKEELQRSVDRLAFEKDELKMGGGIEEEPLQGTSLLVDLEEPRTPTNSLLEDAHQKIVELEALVEQHRTEEHTRSEEIYQLVTQIEREKQDNLRLAADVGARTQDVSRVSSELARTAQELDDTRGKLEGVSNESSVKENSFYSQTEEYKKELADLQEKLRKFETDNETLRQELQDRDVSKVMELQDTRVEYTGQVTLLNNKITALKQELETANKNILLLKDSDTSLQDMLEEMSGIRGELERVSAENTELSAQLSAQHRELEERKQQSEVELNECRRQSGTQIEKLKSEQRDEVASINKEQSTLAAEWQEKYEAEKEEKEGEVKRRGEEEERLSQEISKLSDDCQRLAHELNVMMEQREKDKTSWEYKCGQLEESKMKERERLEEIHRSQLTPFKTKIKEMQFQITKLKDEKEDQDQEISDLTRHVFESNSDCAQLTNDVSALQSKIETADKTISVLQDQISSKTAENLDITDNMTTTQDKLDACQLTLTELQKQLDTVLNERQSLTTQLEAMKQEKEELEGSAGDLELLVNDMKRKMNNSDEEHKMKCTQMQDALNSVMEELDSQKREYTTAEEARDSAHAQLAELKEQNGLLTKSLENNNDGTEVLSEQNRLLQQRYTELQEANAGVQQRVRAAEDVNKTLTKEEATLRDSLSALQHTYTTTRDTLQSELTELKQTLEQVQNEKEDSLKQVSVAVSERDAIRAQADASQRAFDDKFSDLTAQLDEVKEALQSREQELESQTSLAQQQETLIHQLQEQCSTQTSGRESMSDKLNSMQGDLNAQRENLETLNKELQEERANAIRLQEELGVAVAAKEDLGRKKEELECKASDSDKTDKSTKAENLKLVNKIKELETDLEIRNKSLAKLDADMINQTADVNSRISALEVDLESSHTTSTVLTKQCNKAAETVHSLEKKLEENVKKHEQELKKGEVLEGKLREELAQLENKLHEETANHQKAKEGLGKASQGVGKLRGYVKEQENRIEHLTKINEQLKQKSEQDLASHSASLAEVQHSYMTKLEHSAETENKLKGELKRGSAQLADLTTERTDLEGRVAAQNEEKRQLSEIMKEKMEENRRLEEEVERIKNMIDNTQNEEVDKAALALKLSEKEDRLGKQCREMKLLENQLETYKQSLNQIQGIVEEQRGGKEAMPDNDNKLADVSLPAQVKGVIANLSTQLTQKNGDLKSLTDHRNQLKGKLMELKKKADGRISELLEEKNIADNHISEISEEKKKLEESAINLRATNETSAQAIAEKDETLAEKDEKLAEKDEKLAEKDEKLAEKDEKLAEKEQELKVGKEMFDTSAEEMRAELDTCRHQIAELEKSSLNESHQLCEEQALQTESLSKLRAEHEALVSRLTEEHETFAEATTQQHAAELSTRSEEIIELEKRLCERETCQRSALAELEKEREEMSSDLEATNNTLLGDIETLKTELSSKKEELSSVRSRLDETVEETNKVKETCSSLELERESLSQEIGSLRDELSTSHLYLEKQEDVQATCLETEQTLRQQEGELRAQLQEARRQLQDRNSAAMQLTLQVQDLKSDLTDRESEQEKLTQLCGQFKSKIKDIETSLHSGEQDLTTLQQENSRLSSHAKNLEVCFASLKEEKNNIVESFSQMVADGEEKERAHGAQLQEAMEKLRKEHVHQLEQMDAAMQEKLQRASEEGNHATNLHNQVKKLELSLGRSKQEAQEMQAKHTVSISEYSSKLLSSEKNAANVRQQLAERDATLQCREEELARLQRDKSRELAELKQDSIPKPEHEEIVFNLEMAYNMNMQEQTENLEAKVKQLESQLGSAPSSHGRSRQDSEDLSPPDKESQVSDLKCQLESLSRRHKTELDAVRNEAIFAARQEYDVKLRHWQESHEQKHLEEMGQVMTENSKERQRLLREVEVVHRDKQPDRLTDKHLNSSAGRISVSSEPGGEQYLLDTELEYLKQILFKYLRGEHTDQLLKVIVAILRYSDGERAQLLSGVAAS